MWAIVASILLIFVLAFSAPEIQAGEDALQDAQEWLDRIDEQQRRQQQDWNRWEDRKREEEYQQRMEERFERIEQEQERQSWEDERRRQWKQFQDWQHQNPIRISPQR